jgi:hypothetical protein
MASSNNLQSLPEMRDTVFDGTPIHFVTDEKQDAESTPNVDRPQMFYLSNYLYKSPDAHSTSILPVDNGERLLKFPFNCECHYIFTKLKESSFFSTPLFGASPGLSTPYALRNTNNIISVTRRNVWIYFRRVVDSL